MSAVRAAGFENVEVIATYNSYIDVPDPSDAQEFGTQGLTFRASKPNSTESSRT